MDPASLIVMLVIGAIAGWLATVIVGALKMGWLGTIILGIAGGVVGGWLLNALKIGLNFGSPIVNAVVTSAIGAIVLILLARLIGL